MQNAYQLNKVSKKTMRVLLVNTPIDKADTLGKFSKVYDDLKMVPIGIAYLAAVLRKNNVDVNILDQYAECLTEEQIFSRVKDYSPDLIGYGSTTPNYSAAIDLTRRIHAKFPDIKVVMGGQHPSIFPEETLSIPEVDFVIRDEGEYSLLSLCRALESGKGFDEIKGLSYKDEAGTIKHNPSSESVNIDELPWPAYDLLPMHVYSSPSYTRFALPVYQMSASRGCPNQCTYCINAELNIAARYRKRDVDNVLDEMEMLVNKYGARQIQFWDPIFPLGKKHAFEFCDKLMARGLHKKIVWNSTTYAEFLDKEIVEKMAAAGCKGIGFGIESAVPELLKSVNKKSDLTNTIEMCKVARKNGMVVVGSFILGLPGETREMSKTTIDFSKKLDIHYAQFSIFTPYPGTPVYRDLKEKGLISLDEDTDFSRFNQSVGLTEHDPIYVPEGRTAEELKKLQRQAYSEFYFRIKIVLMQIPHLKISMLVRMLKSFFAVLALKAESLTAKD